MQSWRCYWSCQCPIHNLVGATGHVSAQYTICLVGATGLACQCPIHNLAGALIFRYCICTTCTSSMLALSMLALKNVNNSPQLSHVNSLCSEDHQSIFQNQYWNGRTRTRSCCILIGRLGQSNVWIQNLVYCSNSNSVSAKSTCKQQTWSIQMLHLRF
jgi:hypothetical protein